MQLIQHSISSVVLLAARMTPECCRQLDLSSATSVLEFWLRKNSESRLKYQEKFIQKVTEVEEVSLRGNGLRKQVTKAKEGPWELRREKVAAPVQEGRRRSGGKAWKCSQK